jgi:putative DNA primase/helicase
MTAAAIAAALGGKRSGSNTFKCCCPAHEDRTPSLSVSERDGKILVKCFAGCAQGDVIDALKALDLWEQKPLKTTAKRHLGPIIAEYVYTDELHRPLIRVTRHIPKDFCQWSPNATGGWRAGIGDSWRPLYRLPEVIEGAIVFIVEGEKDVEALRSHGFVATCNLMGAGKWCTEYNEVFRGKTVMIIPDRDEPGMAHAMTILAGVKPFAADVVLVDLESAKDASEWFEQGHSEVELISVLEAHWTREGAAHGESY